MRPLDGITVVTLEHAIAAPFCTRQLADLGARVIKIERPGSGDFARDYDTRVRGLASHFVWTNRSKESVTLDVKHAEARRDPRAACSRAPTCWCRTSHRAPRRGSASVTPSCRRSILDSSSVTFPGTAATVPMPAGKPTICSSRANRDSCPSPARPRRRARRAIRSRTSPRACTPTRASSRRCCNARSPGVARTSTSRCSRRWSNGWASRCTTHSRAQPPPRRTGAAHATIYPYGPFRAGDGKLVMFGLQNEREWAVFCDKVLQQPALASDPRFASNAQRVAARAELDDVIHEALASLTAPEVDRAARCGGHRQCANQRGCGSVGSSAAQGPRTLDRSGNAAGQGPRIEAASGTRRC